MATLKKQRQRKTMEIKRTLGVSIGFARQLAREVVDSRYDLVCDDLLRHPEVVSFERIKPECPCCDEYFIFKTRKGSFTYKYGQYTFRNFS